MTVFELIQKLAQYNSTDEVKFLADFEHSSTAIIGDDEVDVDVAFDDYLDLDEVDKPWADNEVIFNLKY